MIFGALGQSALGDIDGDEVIYPPLSRLSAVASTSVFKKRADYVQPGGFVLWNDDSPVTWNDDTNVEWN